MLAYLAREEGRTSWDLWVVPIARGRADSVRDGLTSAGHKLAGDCEPVVPAFSADRRWVYAIRHSLGQGPRLETLRCPPKGQAFETLGDERTRVMTDVHSPIDEHRSPLRASRATENVAEPEMVFSTLNDGDTDLGRQKAMTQTEIAHLRDAWSWVGVRRWTMRIQGILRVPCRVPSLELVTRNCYHGGQDQPPSRPRMESTIRLHEFVKPIGLSRGLGRPITSAAAEQAQVPQPLSYASAARPEPRQANDLTFHAEIRHRENTYTDRRNDVTPDRIQARIAAWSKPSCARPAGSCSSKTRRFPLTPIATSPCQGWAPSGARRRGSKGSCSIRSWPSARRRRRRPTRRDGAPR